MSRIYRTLFSSLVFILFSACSALQDEGRSFTTVTPGALEVALYPGFAPVVFHDPQSGETVGIDVDVLKAFADLHDLQLVIEEHSFDGIWELPAQGVVDIAGSGISRLDSRLVPGMTWSEPYYTVRRSLSIRAADANRLRSIADFAGGGIGFTPGSTGEHDTRARAPENTRLLGYEIEEEAIADLLSGRIDGIARGDVSSLYDARTNSALAVTDLHYFEPREYFVFAVPEQNRELQAALNDFLTELRETGEIDAIVGSYLAIGVKEQGSN